MNSIAKTCNKSMILCWHTCFLQENQQQQKLDEIKSQVIQAIGSRCSCINIGGATFSCRGAQGNFENTVVFRAMVTVQASSALISADVVVTDIDDWVKSSPSITVGLATLDIDPSCPAMLASTDSDDCEVVTESPSPSSSDSSSIGVIVGAVLAVVVVILIVVIIIVAVLVYLRRKGSYR